MHVTRWPWTLFVTREVDYPYFIYTCPNINIPKHIRWSWKHRQHIFFMYFTISVIYMMSFDTTSVGIIAVWPVTISLMVITHYTKLKGQIVFESWSLHKIIIWKYPHNSEILSWMFCFIFGSQKFRLLTYFLVPINQTLDSILHFIQRTPSKCYLKSNVILCINGCNYRPTAHVNSACYHSIILVSIRTQHLPGGVQSVKAFLRDIQIKITSRTNKRPTIFHFKLPTIRRSKLSTCR